MHSDLIVIQPAPVEGDVFNASDFARFRLNGTDTDTVDFLVPTFLWLPCRGWSPLNAGPFSSGVHTDQLTVEFAKLGITWQLGDSNSRKGVQLIPLGVVLVTIERTQ